MTHAAVDIAPAQEADVPLISSLIRELAEYEKLEHQAVATEAALRLALFGPRPAAETVIVRVEGAAAGFALYFHTFSTFLGKHGLYLEDLFVRPAFRGRGIGKALLVHLAQLALERGCGRFEWAVLDWNRPARDFYEALGAKADSAWINYRIGGEALERLAAGLAGDSPQPASPGRAAIYY
ncbi:MAG: GNAT family N-acetyltransferase [Pseudomonadota bacterium]|nr:GNAT family N-acetyltransferase [Pseudomonadota bacterium]